MFKKLSTIMLATALLGLTSCSSDDDKFVSNDKTGPKPGIDLMVVPDNYKYGDKVSITGLLTDDRNLEHYELLLLNSKGDTLATKYQMLLGKQFNMDDFIQIPLPKNASTDDLRLVAKLDNTRNGEAVETFDLPAVATPSFETLNLVLGNGSIVELTKQGDVFTMPTEQVFPAKVKGIISTTTSKNGIYWGTKHGEIATMTNDSITIGGDVESSFTVTFNPKTFELSFSERHVWKPLPAADCYYLLGTISGHWQDGEITTEKNKMRMKGFESQNDSYYTWTAPEGDDPNVGMWGQTAAGVFRMKRGAQQGYILWDGQHIVQSATDDATKSFPLTAGGAFTIKTNFTAGTCTSVEVTGSGKSLLFTNNKVVVNGNAVTPTIGFCGQQLHLKAGTAYIYEGTMTLQKGQKISSDFDLSSYTCNPDLFTGGGNTTWTLKANTGTYYVRMDVFSGAFYACPVAGYPDVLYMDGWSWAPTQNSTAVVWSDDNVLPVVHTTGHRYEATFYNFGWGGDVAFYVVHPSTGHKYRLPNAFFPASLRKDADGFHIPSGAGYYKVVIDLKDGIHVAADGTVTAKGDNHFTMDFVAQ